MKQMGYHFEHNKKPVTKWTVKKYFYILFIKPDVGSDFRDTKIYTTTNNMDTIDTEPFALDYHKNRLALFKA